MSFDLDQLRGVVAAHGRVARVVVADVAGSAPREVGAAMLVWHGGQSGTIGGGALEYQAAASALEHSGISRHPLGPALGQCCGGAVTLVCEHFDAETLPDAQQIYARSIGPKPQAQPLWIKRATQKARNAGAQIKPLLKDGWMIEPISRPSRPIWIYGAGHVGRALVATLAPLPDMAITWVDVAADRYPDAIPAGVTCLPAANPADSVALAPPEAEHLILTYSHALDLELCHRILSQAFASCGLIGSATKWARFRTRLAGLGHSPAQISRICCPIGQPALGKHPQAIAISVAGALLSPQGATAARRDIAP